MPQLTIALAVYNAEKYLDVCLDSIINQSFADIDILCVDDGSTDSSLAILQNYAAFDKRVRLVRNHKNLGLAATRNVLVQHTVSPYIMFVDADDFISPFMAEVMLKNIYRWQSDFVYGNCIAFDTKTMATGEWRLISDIEFQKITGSPVFAAADVPAYLPFRMHVMTWCKLFRTEFIQNIPFVNLALSEDEPFFFECFLRAKKISYELTPLYYYRQNVGSSLINSCARFPHCFEAMHQVQNVFEKLGVFDRYKEHLLCHQISRLLCRTAQASGEIKQQMFTRFKNEFSALDLSAFNLNILRQNPVFFEMQNILNMSFEEFNLLYQGNMPYEKN